MTSHRPLWLLCIALSSVSALAACSESATSPDGGGTVDGSVSGDSGPSAGDGATRPDARPDASRRDGGPIDAPPPPDGGNPLEPLRELLCAPLARAICTVPWECACDDPGVRPDETACVAEQTAACMESMAFELGAGVVSGAARIDEEALARCAAQLPPSFEACSGLQIDMLDWCIRAFIDRAPAGSPCSAGTPVCADGDGHCGFETCATLPGDGDPCLDDLALCRRGLVCRAGACRPPAIAGAACEADSQCADALLCSGGICRAALVAVGGTCAVTSECVANARCTGAICVAAVPASCDADDDCASLARCQEEVAPRCGARRPLGAPCNYDECVAEAYCLHEDGGPFPGPFPVPGGGAGGGRPGGGEGSGVCTARPALGSACTYECAVGATCVDGTCRALGYPGEPCALGPDTDGCQADLACVDGICGAAPGYGLPCASIDECTPGLRCRTDPGSGAGACLDPVAPGVSCSLDRGTNECDSFHYCDWTTMVCTARLGSLEECGGGECADGLDCIYDEVEELARCRAIPGIGEACSGPCLDGGFCSRVVIGGHCVGTICDQLRDFRGGEPEPLPGGGGSPPPRPD